MSKTKILNRLWGVEFLTERQEVGMEAEPDNKRVA